MQVEIEDIIARYGAEIARLTQRALVAEARADAAEKRCATEGANPNTQENA